MLESPLERESERMSEYCDSETVGNRRMGVKLRREREQGRGNESVGSKQESGILSPI